MKNINKITCFEFGILIYFLIRSTSLGMAVISYINIGGVDGYLCPLIGTAIGFIPLIIFIKIMNYEPSLNLFEKIDKLFGKYLGKIINTILIATIIFLCTIIFWNLLNFIASQYLFRTSSYYIAIMFGIGIYYLCSKKINVTFRVANILFYISIIIFCICFLGLINQSDLNNILPFLEHGIIPPIISGFAHVGYSILPLFILLIIPKNNIKNNEKLTKTIFIFYLLTNISKAIVTFLTISIFGIDITSLYEFPDFILLRRISTSGFFQRFENILAIQWIFDLFIMITMCFNFIKGGYRHLIKNKFDNIFILIVIYIVCLISSKYLFNSNTSGNIFIIYILPYILWGLLFTIPFIVYLKIKKT